MYTWTNDTISAWTFYAESEQVAALAMIKKRSTWLIQTYPEIGERVDELYHDIAADIFWTEYMEFPDTCMQAVALAMKELTDKESRNNARITKARSSLESNIGNRVAHNTLAGLARQAKWPAIDTKAMTLLRWIVPWTDKEKVQAFTLWKDSNENGDTYKQIATTINLKFHEGETIRSSKQVRDFIGAANRENTRYQLWFNTSHNTFDKNHLPSDLAKWWVKFDPETLTVWISDNVPLEHRIFWARHEHTCAPKPDPKVCVKATRKEIQIIQDEHPHILNEYIQRRQEMMLWVLAFGEKNPGQVTELVIEKLTQSLQILESF